MHEKDSLKKKLANVIGVVGVTERFVTIQDGKEYNAHLRIIKDKETGVNYLEGRTGSLTPLLDRDGKVIVDETF